MNDIRPDEIKNIFFIRDRTTKLVRPDYGDRANPLSGYTKEELEYVIEKLDYEKWRETRDSLGNFIVGMALSVAAAAIAYVISGISLLLLKPALAPLLIPNPFESFILLAIGLVVGGAVCYSLYCKYAKPYFVATQQHWNFSETFIDHIDNVKMIILRRFPKR